MKKTRQDELIEENTHALNEFVPRMMRSLRCQIHQSMQDGGKLTRGQGYILMHVRMGIRTVAGLAEHSHVSKPTISRKVDLLVERGFLQRNRDPQDRRTVLLSLTHTGETELEARRQFTDTWIKNALKDLNEEELQDLLRGIAILNRTFSSSSLKKCRHSTHALFREGTE